MTDEQPLALNELRGLLPAVLEDIPLAAMVTRTDGTIVYVNRGFERITGYAREEAVGQHTRVLKSGWQGQEFYRELWDTVLQGRVFEAQLVNRRKDGALYIEEMSITPIPGDDGKPAYFASLANDVSELRRSQQRLQLFEAATRAIAAANDLKSAYSAVLKLVCELADWSYGEAWEMESDSTLRCVTNWHTEGEALEGFAEVSRALRLAPGEGLPGRAWATAAPEWDEDVTELGGGFVRTEAAIAAGLKAGFAVPIVADGEVLAVLAFFARGRRRDESELTNLVSTLGSGLGTLVRRRRAEESLTTERNRLAVTLRSIADGVITTDQRGCISNMNPVAETLTGWRESEAQGRELHEVFHIVNEYTRVRSASPVAQVLASGGPVALANHTVLISRNGEEYVIGDSAAPIRDGSGEVTGVVLVFRDETAMQRLERELRRADKLDSLGVLAGGIAHDFNNALTGISAHISLARLELPENSEQREILREAELACKRAASLTRQLLTFSKGGLPIRKLVGLEPLVRQTATFAATGSPSVCIFEFADDLANVEADEGQVSQLVHNLVLNATQAMPSGGTVTVSGRNVDIDDESGLSLAPGKYVRITVRDTGPGIPAELIDRLFDPYFTTKKEGSGLGLTVGYSVARNHDGLLTVQSRPGMGASFHLYLPAAAAEYRDEKASAGEARVRPAAILLMDDEASIRRAMGLILTRMGHRVDEAAGGEDALRMYQSRLEQGSRYDVVVLDLTVPGGMGGYEAFQRIRELDATVCAIVSSGYSSDPIMAKFQEYGFAGVLPKPYSPADLQTALASVLGDDRVRR